MGVTPMVDPPGKGRPAPRGRPGEVRAKATAIESGEWGYVVHPSMLPTIFAPSGDVPHGDGRKEPTARKV
jgi:hypothetical protein